MSGTTSSRPELFIDAEEYPCVVVYQWGKVTWSLDSARFITEMPNYDREVGMIPKYGLHFILNLRNPRTT